MHPYESAAIDRLRREEVLRETQHRSQRWTVTGTTWRVRRWSRPRREGDQRTTHEEEQQMKATEERVWHAYTPASPNMSNNGCSLRAERTEPMSHFRLRVTTRHFTILTVTVLILALTAPVAVAMPPGREPSSDAAAGAVPARTADGPTYSELPDQDLWSLVEASERTVHVGLKAPGLRRGVWRDRVLLTDAQRAHAQRGILAQRGTLLLSEDELLPVLQVKLADAKALTSLRRLPYVDYVEPVSVEITPQDAGFGCNGKDTPPGGPTYTDPIPQLPQEPRDYIPRNFAFSRVEEAWTRGAHGQGTTIGVLDTGIFEYQTQLQPSGFSAGLSGGRRVLQFNETADPYLYDRCNHGTRVAGTAAAPRDGVSLVGVAWKASLTSVKVGDDVWMNWWNTEDIIDGMRRAIWHTNGGNTRVIAMAFGAQFTNSRIADEIRWHYANNPNVLFLAAAGTEPYDYRTVCAPSGWGVKFPARMAEVTAVTGVTPQGTLHYTACDGPEVDLRVVVGPVPALGRRPEHIIKFGGSSAATATAAGIASLVWSIYPNWTAHQVRARLMNSSTGVGVVDAYKAVGGFDRLTIGAPLRVEPGESYTVTAAPLGDGPFSYQWSTGATTKSLTLTMPTGVRDQRVSVTVTDLKERKSLSASKVIEMGYPDVECPPKLRPNC